MGERRKHDVRVSTYQPELGDPWGRIDVRRFPDGSTANQLDADEMREVGDMMIEAADELEEWEDEDDA